MFQRLQGPAGTIGIILIPGEEVVVGGQVRLIQTGGGDLGPAPDLQSGTENTKEGLMTKPMMIQMTPMTPTIKDDRTSDDHK